MMAYTGDTLDPVDRRRPQRYRDRTDELPAERAAHRDRHDPAGPRIIMDVTLGDPRMSKKHKHKKKHKKKDAEKTTEVVIVGAGFAGIGCAKELAKHHDVHVTLLDRHNYHQFLPLLYQVATYQLSPTDVAMDLVRSSGSTRGQRQAGRGGSIDPAARVVTTGSGGTFAGDYLVLAAGSQPNFFDTPGAEHVFPLYSLDDAERLRSRVLTIFEDADRDPSLVEKGALNIVIVGAGATGTEVAGAIAELVRDVMPSEFHDLAVDKARVIVVDLGDAVLGPFSPKAHAYASKVLLGLGVDSAWGLGEGDPARPRRAVGRLDDPHALRHLGRRLEGRTARRDLGPQAGTRRPDRCRGRSHRGGSSGDLRGRRHRQCPRRAREPVPAAGFGRPASGSTVAANIIAEIDGEPREAFDYHDKGIMAMIGRGAAVAEMGEHRHELHGAIAFAAWLGSMPG